MNKISKEKGAGSNATPVGAEPTAGPVRFAEWCLVELFGHQKIVGKVSEATLAGGAFLRVDVPAFDSEPAFTRYYGPGAIYSINPITEEVARGLCERYRNEPVSRFELPQIEEKYETGNSHEDEYDDHE